MTSREKCHSVTLKLRKFFTQLEPKTADSPLVKRSLEKKMSLCGPDKSNKFGGIAVEELERIDN